MYKKPLRLDKHRCSIMGIAKAPLRCSGLGVCSYGRLLTVAFFSLQPFRPWVNLFSYHGSGKKTFQIRLAASYTIRKVVTFSLLKMMRKIQKSRKVNLRNCYIFNFLCSLKRLLCVGLPLLQSGVVWVERCAKNFREFAKIYTLRTYGRSSSSTIIEENY